MQKLSFSVRWGIFSLALLLLGAGWIWASAAPANSTTSGRIPAPRQGFLAPDFSLQDAAGQAYHLADLKGRPVLVNFWASWCIPCQTEMPAIQRVYATYKDQGLIVLAVNATSDDNRQNAIAFANSKGLTFPVLFDVTGEVSHLYETRAFPTSFFIGKDGVIQDVVVGGPMSEALLRTRIVNLLQEAP